ncbi:MAG: VCBS repeat-containing protein [Deltaproteobacteria bacterium]|nr:VCBS repeat-containing protein [Deltaproteobacteria bacterium]
MSRSLLVSSLALLAALAIVAPTVPLAAGSARADVPALPLPPPLPSATDAVVGQLAARLLAEEPAIAGAFSLNVHLDVVTADAKRPKALEEHVTAAFEAALRRRAVTAPRLPDGADGVVERFDVRLIAERGQLAASARRIRLPANVWDRLADPAGQTVAVAFGSQPMDLEIRTLLGLGRREVKVDDLRVVPVGARSVPGLLDAPILDLAILDADRDGEPDVVALQPRVLRVLAWQKGGLSVERLAYRLDVLPPSPARLRQPMGRVVPVTRADGTYALVVASSDRATALVLGVVGSTLTPLTEGAPEPGWPLYATNVDSWLVVGWPRGVDVLTGPVRERHVLGADTPVGALDGSYAVRAFPAQAAKTPAWNPYLLAADPGGRVTWRAETRRGVGRLTGRGDVAVVADLDRDGEAELFATDDALGGGDRVTIYGRLDDARGPRRLWTAPVGASVTAAAAGDIDRDGFDELVVATWDGRRAEVLIMVPKT